MDARTWSTDDLPLSERPLEVVVQISIDAAKCQGHNVCLGFIPDMLDVDRDGYPTIAGTGEVAPADAEVARQAADNCPEKAISVLEEA